MSNELVSPTNVPLRVRMHVSWVNLLGKSTVETTVDLYLSTFQSPCEYLISQNYPHQVTSFEGPL